MVGRAVRCRCGNITRFRERAIAHPGSVSVEETTQASGAASISVVDSTTRLAPRNLVSILRQAGAIPGILFCFAGLILMGMGMWLLADAPMRIRIGVAVLGGLILSAGGLAGAEGMRHGRLWAETLGNRPIRVVGSLSLVFVSLSGLIVLVYAVFS